MKKIIFVLTLLLLVSPAWAKVEVSCTADNDTKVVSVYYAMSTGDTNLPRAFGLDVTLDNDAKILSASNFNSSFWVHPGSIDINTAVTPAVVDSNGTAILDTTVYPQAGDLPGPPDGNGMTIEMGSLYEDGVDPAPASSGLLFTFTVDKDCDITIAGNTALGKVVLENADEDNTLYTGCAISSGPACKGDFNASGDITTGDISLLVNYWIPNKNFLGKAPLGLTGYVVGMDLNASGDITTGDISILVNHWIPNKNFLGKAPCMP